ncbi:MAG: 2-succinylbenzoate--CoA ligase [Oscillatoriales cyanobacterium]|nr:MAG: 2-succinylbenzoate--CoA ligase [Oscillatoriales cyanobacterium]TAH19435.1 MAG: 2-succinylbenzoate--CoA ligase [Oscillatoriales cyanobacterium]
MATNVTTNILDIASRLPDNWLIGGDSREIVEICDRTFQKLTKNKPQQTPQIIFLAEPEPIQFIASFIAGCATKSQIFLCNPNWVKSEWQQVFDLVKPDIILGNNTLQNLTEIGFIASPLHRHKNNPQSPITNYQLPSIMIPTGGSSGKIRFAMHTWETLTASVQGFQQYFEIEKINSFCTLPLYHVSGLMQFMRSFTTGGKLAIQSFKELETGKKFDIEPESFFISLVPTQLQRLLQNPDTANWLSRFHTVLLGGAPAWPELLEIARKYQIKLALTYGMTETASQIATLKPADFLAGNNSSGQILPHATVTIRGSKGEILCYNQVGNIAVSAKSLAWGYYPDKLGDRKYLQLDDLGFFDQNNYLNIIGRNSDKIITGGENVFPTEVEAAIKSTNLVTDVAVIGLLDKHWGQVVTAIYVPANSEVTVKTLQVAIEDKLSKFKQPKNWVLVENFPRNSQGKINREQLQQIALKY